MLTLHIPAIRVFDEDTYTFSTVKSMDLRLEHSLLSISKWESIYCKPFLSSSREMEHSAEEILQYIECMTITPNVPKVVYNVLTKDNIEAINQYINHPMTATTIHGSNNSSRRETITSEIIYYWMISYNIPFDPCEKWHLNRLLTLIRVCSIKNNPKKMSQQEIMAQNKAWNAARRKALHTKG